MKTKKNNKMIKSIAKKLTGEIKRKLTINEIKFLCYIYGVRK